MFTLGLTGSIGMGKSTAVAIFAKHGIPVWDADEAVRRIYEPNGGGGRALMKIVPEAVSDGNCRVNKAKLKEAIDSDPSLLARIEAVVHPLVKQDRESFFRSAESSGAELAIAEIPLLFETQADKEFDAVAVASTSASTQRRRVMQRANMTSERFDQMLQRQLPDSEKRRRADYIIRSDSMETSTSDIASILSDIRGSIDCT